MDWMPNLGTECLCPEEVTKGLGRWYCSTNMTTTGSQFSVIYVAFLQNTVKYFDCGSSGSNHQNGLTKLEGSPGAHVDRRWLAVNCCGVLSI